MRDLSNLIAAVTLESGVAASALLALQAAEQHLADANAQIAQLKHQFDAGAVDPDQLTKVLDTVSTTTAQLSAAIPANADPAPGTVVTALPGASTARTLASADVALQARDAASATVPAIGTAAPTAPGAFAQPTETATAGLAAGPGPAVVTQP